MELFERICADGHEQVVFFSDASCGLKAIVAIHDTTLGPALGGARFFPYRSEEDALIDVLRLSRGMTYKASMAGLNLGGGKAVIIGDPKTRKTEALLRAFGRFVERLGGRYITAEDVGTSVQDMEFVHMETRHVTGVSHASGGGGDPSPVTAYGIFMGMKAAAKERLRRDSLAGLKIAVQGLGKVGRHLTDHLLAEGSRVTACDIDPEKTALVVEKGVTVVGPDQIFDVECDIFAPCALGAVLNDQTIPRLKCGVVAGGANNQLLDEKKHGEALQRRDILYAPDYVINAGGLINVYVEIHGYDRNRALRLAEGIHDKLVEIFRTAKKDGVPTNVAADRLAEERIRAIARVKRL